MIFWFLNKNRLPFFIALIVLTAKFSWAENIFSFDGQMDLSKNVFTLVLQLDEKSSVTATVRRESQTGYRVLLDIDHLKTPFFDFLGKIESSVKMTRDDNASGNTLADATLNGSIWSQNSLVDYKPVRELSGSFMIKDLRLHLKSMAFGNIKCRGFIDLVPPYRLDAVLDLLDVDMKDFLNFWSGRKTYESSGAVSGEIKASGTVDNLALKGRLESSQGYVEKLDYDNISLNIEGVYPHMTIARSTISKSDGVSFKIDGPFNLSDRANFKKQIKALTMAPLVRNSGPESEWMIKRLSPEESQSGVTELKYRLREKKDVLGIGTSADDDTDMFGLERIRKF